MPYRTLNNIGQTIEIPSTPEEDFTYFRTDEVSDYRAYYEQNGYVVIRGAVDAAICDAANDAFDAEVYPSRAFIYRQTTARAERNEFTAEGFLVNPILNVQSVDPERFPDFRKTSVDVITNQAIQTACSNLFGQPGKIVQSMYFQGNPSTWPHQDTYYLDATDRRMTAVWIAT